MRRVLKGGLLGAAPGALLIAVVAILHATEVITSDQSQIGFLGVPLLFFGLLIGMLGAAAAERSTPAVLAWMGIGLVAGIAFGAALTQVIVGGWLILVPLFIFGGGVLGAWRHENRHPPPAATSH